MDGSASRTALMVAAYRARASARPDPICSDPWAARLAGNEGQEYARRYDEAWSPAELWIAVRTAAIDREVRRRLALPDAVRQVVLLGAGLDTRAQRIAGQGVRWFEVDHPDTQREKLGRLRELRDYPVEAATYAPCDFERTTFTEALARVGFDSSLPALFIWEGVVLYLEEKAVRCTLRAIASLHPRSTVIFDCVGKAMATGEVRQADDRAARAFLDDLVEPIRFGVDDVVPMLFDEGFRRIESRTFDELCLDFTRTWERSRKFRFQRLVVASAS